MEYNSDEALKLGNQLCFPLYAAARRVVNAYTPHLKPLGLTYTQYICFLALWEKDDVTVGELGTRLCLDNGTLTPLLKKLEAAGYVVRTRSKEDERSVHITLTEEGRNLKDKVRHIPQEIGKCVPLDPEKAGQLYTLLYDILGCQDAE